MWPRIVGTAGNSTLHLGVSVSTQRSMIRTRPRAVFKTLRYDRKRARRCAAHAMEHGCIIQEIGYISRLMVLVGTRQLMGSTGRPCELIHSDLYYVIRLFQFEGPWNVYCDCCRSGALGRAQEGGRIKATVRHLQPSLHAAGLEPSFFTFCSRPAGGAYCTWPSQSLKSVCGLLNQATIS